ncbi:adenosylcobinamide-GDP ribazoletransferase [Tumebacillus sp. ITR2]|uniref:Adenosylcobinamide-GDP ribazoletransferase n=1 Tax=Tumebacillus amylolyticus TaxID=2801339 RepID=A0ABS1J6M0_9BACL|nr:adenosylcobinamide-GDP ribazoletransferase [Tumebacillus amylolyticus]MBL0385820.1 adenosylcobinamide-GDP ribazoletransferase [Tumebacillus amylolyticus]
MNAFFHAVGFLTRLPVPKNLKTEAWSKSPPWYPFVGLIIGSLLACISYYLPFIAPPAVTALLLLSLWVFLTGGLHLDGLMDTADGFGSYRSKERILEIMKDSRVGGMGVLAAILVLGNKAAALFALQGQGQFLVIALVAAPLMGRLVMMMALYGFKYAREDGLAQSLRTESRVEGWVVFFFTLIVCLLVGGWAALLVCAVTASACGLLISSSLRKIGGLTGDVYGALCEVTETVVLLTLSVVGHWT